MWRPLKLSIRQRLRLPFPVPVLADRGNEGRGNALCGSIGSDDCRVIGVDRLTDAGRFQKFRCASDRSDGFAMFMCFFHEFDSSRFQLQCINAGIAVGNEHRIKQDRADSRQAEIDGQRAPFLSNDGSTVRGDDFCLTACRHNLLADRLD